jgi:dienelactone hydrolase
MTKSLLLRALSVAVISIVTTACGGSGGTSPPSTPFYSVQHYSIGEIQKFVDVPYSTRPNEGGEQITSDTRAGSELGSSSLTLVQDIYVPPNASAATPQPLLIWIHGGGMVAGDKRDLLDEAEGYARAGYVVTSINYRLTPKLNLDASLKTRANTQASEDLMSAIRFMRANALIYGIDTTRLATIGYSAGGELSLINAIEADTLANTNPDLPAVSAKVQGAISTGATLINGQWDSDAVLNYQPMDSPVMLMHANPADSVTHATWLANALPSASRINDSGNTCTLVSQPDMTHTTDLSFGGPQFTSVNSFLVMKLRLPQ